MTAEHQREQAGFLLAIRERPHDVGPRLIYADWLEEHGEVDMAVFIREPDPSLVLGSPRTKAYRHRMALLRSTLPPVKGPICLYFAKRIDPTSPTLTEDRGFGGWMASRNEVAVFVNHGFVSSWACTEEYFFKHAREWFSRHPIVDVRLIRKSPNDDLPVRDPFGASFLSSWTRRNEVRRLDWSDLPPELFDRLEGGERVFFDRRRYPRHYQNYARDLDAYRALSRVCVDWGRNIAGLPPLVQGA